MSEIFQEQNVFLVEEKLEDKEQLLRLIAQKANELGYVHSESDCFRGLLERERLQSTGFEDGFAIPHCKDKTVKEPRLLIFKTHPIPWNTLDGQPVQFSFVLLIPEQSAAEHLKYLSKIAKSLLDEDYRRQLKQLGDRQRIYSLVKNRLED